MIDLPKKPTWHVQPRARARARSLRREMTKAEKIVWYMVRAHRLEGAGFRRQTPIGPYIVDFVSHSSRLIIEIDGGQHFEDQHLKKDARRDAYFAGKGYRVLRFTNLDVLTNREGVYATIAEMLGKAPSLPSPASGGGDGARRASGR
jgi:very-short-patch-repair endonuclease